MTTIDCFDSRCVFDLLMDGAFGEKMTHLLSCPVCLSLVRLVVNTRSGDQLKFAKELDAARMGERRQPEAISGLRRIFTRERPMPAVLAVPQHEMPINRLWSEATFSFVLVPGFDLAELKDSIDPASLRLEGSLQTKIDERSVYVGDNFIDVTTRAKLSNHLKEDLANHYHVIDVVRVFGRLNSGRKFAAQADIEFCGPTGA